MAGSILQEITNSFWFITEDAVHGLWPRIQNLLENPLPTNNNEELDLTASLGVSFQSNLYPISSYGAASAPEAAPKGSYAVISFDGPISKNDQICGDSGTATKAQLIDRCYNNPNIKGIVLNMCSPGGSISAVNSITSTIAKRNKPIVAYVDELAASAGYWIASFADEIVLKNERVVVGSIGALVTIYNAQKYWEKKGIKVESIYSSHSTLKNHAYRKAMEGDSAPIVEMLDKAVNFFFSDVKSNRPQLKNPKDDTIFKGDVFHGDRAIELDLADKMGEWDVVLESLQNLEAQYNKGGLYV